MATPPGIQESRGKPPKSENGKWSALEPELSVVILGYRNANLLERAVRTFAATASKSVRWELVLVLNGASEKVSRLAAVLLRENCLPVRVLTLPPCRPGAARNQGVRHSRAPLLLFLDDDTECFQDLAAAVVRAFENPAVQAAGGANLTPPGSGPLERATGRALSTWFGAGSMSRRYRETPGAGARSRNIP
jgi:glycosyltransferase involved in cell wall biosynthesis